MCYDVFWYTNNVWLILVLVAVLWVEWKVSISGSNNIYFICSLPWDHWYRFAPHVVQQTFHFLGQAVVCHPLGCTSCENLTQDIETENWRDGRFCFVASLFSNSQKHESLHPPPDLYVFLRLKIRELSRNPGTLWWYVTLSISEIH